MCVSTDKLFSLLPEYVVPYTIHLLAHDPDYVKVQDIEQLKEIKEYVLLCKTDALDKLSPKQVSTPELMCCVVCFCV